MIIISHRANLNGSNKNLENNPKQILETLRIFDVEIDLWCVNDEIFLGHDKPEYKINDDFLKSNKNKLWVHAKNIDCIPYLLNTDINWFWHENDKMTITSKGNIWCYPGTYVKNGITVIFNDSKKYDIPDYCLGICTDYPTNYRS
jgi:hypothetical protein